MNPNAINDHEGKIDYQKFIMMFVRRWYYYAITGFIALAIAVYINKSATPIYEVTSTILVQEQDQRRFNPEDFMSTLNMFSANQMFRNEMLVLKSTALIEKTYTDLNLTTRYFSEGLATKELYKDAPFIVAFNASSPQPIGIRFFLTYLGGTRFRLESDEELVTLYSFSEEKELTVITHFEIDMTIDNRVPVENELFNFTIVFDNPEETLEVNDKFSFSFQSRKQFTNNMKQLMNVQSVDPESSAAVLTLMVSNARLGVDILNTMGENYLMRDILKKRFIAKQTINYIDLQLNIISDSLVKAEKDLESFRVRHDVMDIQQQSSVVLTQQDQLKRELTQLESQIGYYTFIQDYFEENKEIADLIAPSSVGIEDPLLNNLMQELITLHSEKSTMLENKQEKNPYLLKINIRINNLKSTIAENIKYILKTLEVNRKEIVGRMAEVNREISRMPITERQLANFERNFRLNDEVYTYLMQRRSESQIAEASNLPRNEILEPAQLSSPDPIAPKSTQNYAFALFLAVALTSGFIFIMDPTRNKINSKQDLSSATRYPILGRILHNRSDRPLVFHNFPNSGTAESFRSIYTNLQFFKYGKSRQTIMVTSAFAGDGKSFVSINLALAYAKFGYKTVLVEFDLRKPAITQQLEAKQEPGASTYISGAAAFEDIIQKTPYDNLHYVAAGATPPNPTELTASEKTAEMFTRLKEEYEITIIDTPPVGIVIDSLHLVKHTDINLFVVRENHTHKSEFNETIRELESRGIENITLVLNDHKPSKSMQYGYGYYESNESKKKRKKNLEIAPEVRRKNFTQPRNA